MTSRARAIVSRERAREAPARDDRARMTIHVPMQGVDEREGRAVGDSFVTPPMA